jgi:hypothetical protein
MATIARGAASEAHEAQLLLEAALRNGQQWAKDAAAVAKQVDVVAHAAAVARTDIHSAQNAVNALKSDPVAAVASMRNARTEQTAGEDAERAHSAATDEASDLNPGGTPKTQAELVTSASTKLSIMGIDITATRVIGFATFVTLVTLAAIYFSATANKTITITNIELIDATHLNISYTKPNSDFTLRLNDELQFQTVTPAPTVPPLAPQSRKVTAIVSDNTVQITLPASITSVAGQTVGTPAAGTPGGSPAWATSWGTAITHTTLKNQFFGAVGDGVAFVAGAAATAVAAATPSVITVIDDAAAIAAAAAAGAGRTLNAGICSTMPILCNAGLWGGIIALIVAIIIIAVLLKNRRRGGGGGGS